MSKILNCMRKVYSKMRSFIDLILLKIFQHIKLRKNYILLESEGDFTDNIRAFYDYMIENQINEYYHLIWVVHTPRKLRNKIYEKNVRFISRFHRGIHIKAMYYNAVAKWFIVSHFSWPIIWKPEQIVINADHGIYPMKKSTPVKRKCCDYVLSCSEFTAEEAKKIYHVDQDHCLIIGVPRLDMLYKHYNCVHKLFDDVGDDKIILCMPTFRQAKSWIDSSKVNPYAMNIISSFEELAELNSFLKQQHCVLIIKIHHLQDMQFIDSVRLENIRYITDDKLLKFNVQVNQLLENADILLTDYSSVFYDYLLLNRPIGFMVRDMEDYSRGFLSDDPVSEMPGEKIYSLQQLKKFIVNSNMNIDSYESERKRIKEKVFKYFDSNNCERLWNFIKESNE